MKHTIFSVILIVVAIACLWLGHGGDDDNDRGERP